MPSGSDALESSRVQRASWTSFSVISMLNWEWEGRTWEVRQKVGSKNLILNKMLFRCLIRLELNKDTL